MLYDSTVRKVELRFSATDLINKDLFSLSDPFLVCHTVRNGEPFTEIGRTETVQDDLNPIWATTFSFDYDPSLHHSTSLVVDLFDRDSQDSMVLSKHDFLGRATFRLSELLSSSSMKLNLPLRPANAKLLPVTSTNSSSITTESHDGDDHEREQPSPPPPPTPPLPPVAPPPAPALAPALAPAPTPQPIEHEHETLRYENGFEYSGVGAGVGACVGVHHYDEEYDGPASHSTASSKYASNIANTTATEPLPSSHFDYSPPSRGAAGGNGKGMGMGMGGILRTPAQSNATPPTPPPLSQQRKRTLTSMNSTHSTPKSSPKSSSSRITKTTSCDELKRATKGSRGKKVKGNVTIYAETLVPPSEIKIRIRVRSALLKTMGNVLGGFRIVQFYEIQRERTTYGDMDTWSCIYRSEDGIKVDKHNYVVFDDVTIDEGALTNMQNDRKLRIAFYKRHTRTKHELISYVTTNLNQLRKGTDVAAQIQSEQQQSLESSDFETRRHTNTVLRSKYDKNQNVAVVDGAVTLKMEGEFGDDDGLGSVVIKRLSGLNSPTQSAAFSSARLSMSGASTAFEEHGFSLRADHFLNKKFSSSLNDAPRLLLHFVNRFS